ncbi:hypothetical protein [Pseudoalteromonas rubra]|nr:hypothetical protein [Pseudoalteromonas rubra]
MQIRPHFAMQQESSKTGFALMFEVGELNALRHLTYCMSLLGNRKK